MSIYSTVVGGSTFTGAASTLLINNNISGILPIGITNDTDAFTTGGMIFSGSNITFDTSVDGASQYLLATAGIGGIAASAGTEEVTNNTLIFSNSNGISFGLDASTLTASHNAFSATSQLTNYLAPKTHIHGSVSLDLLNLSGATTSASDGLTLSLSGLPAQSQMPSVVSINGASGSLTFNAGTFVNISQDIRSFTFNVTNTSAITTNAQHSSLMSNYAGVGTTSVSTAGSDLAITLNTDGLNLGVPAWLTAGGTGAGAALKGSGTYSQNSGTIEFANSNSMTFGLTDNQMTASFSYTQSTHDHPYLGSGESTYYQTNNLSSVFLTTAALSDHTHDQYVNTSVSSDFLTTAAASDHTHDEYINTSISSNFLTTAAESDHTHSEYVNTSISSQWLTTAMASEDSSLFLYTSASSLLQHTSATSAITASAVNTSATSQWLTTAALSDHTHSDLYIALANSTDYATSVLSATFQTTGDYLTTAALSNHTHSDLYIALGNSTDYATSVLSGTFQTTGAYLTTAMASDNGSNFVGLATTEITGGSATINSSQLLINIPSNAGSLGFSDSNNVSFGIESTASNSSTVLTASIPAFIGTPTTITTTSGTDLKVTAGTAGLNIAHPVWLTTAATGEVTQFVGLLSTGLTGGSWTINSSQLSINIPSNAGSLSFADSNGISFGIASTTSNSSSVVTASFGLVWEIYGNTAGTTSSAVSVLKLSAGTNVTLSGGSAGITIIA